MYEVRNSWDYAEEVYPVIVLFTKEGEPVMLEILDASKFLAQTARATKKSIGTRTPFSLNLDCQMIGHLMVTDGVRPNRLNV